MYRNFGTRNPKSRKKTSCAIGIRHWNLDKKQERRRAVTVVDWYFSLWWTFGADCCFTPLDKSGSSYVFTNVLSHCLFRTKWTTVELQTYLIRTFSSSTRFGSWCDLFNWWVICWWISLHDFSVDSFFERQQKPTWSVSHNVFYCELILIFYYY